MRITLEWNNTQPTCEQIDLAALAADDEVLITSRGVTAPSRAMGADLQLYRTATEAERWESLGRSLPTPIYLLATTPAAHAAILFRAAALRANAELLTDCQTMSELLVRLSAKISSAFVDQAVIAESQSFRVPALTFAEASPGAEWIGRLIAQATGLPKLSSSAQAAVKAGLFLIHDFFDSSHAESQAIEGLSPHTGDYWHAILHRREPDYDNAKYWFRHVGRHVAFEPLARRARQRWELAAGVVAGKLERWKSRLVTNGGWDPFAFVDLCESANRDPDLKTWCEQLQYDEMLIVLESSFRATR